MEDDDDGVQDAAVRALAMAKDMVIEAINVRIPKSQSGTESPFETLEIRVGIHVGDITCGVLGQRLPKFTTCGSGTVMPVNFFILQYLFYLALTHALYSYLYY